LFRKKGTGQKEEGGGKADRQHLPAGGEEKKKKKAVVTRFEKRKRETGVCEAETNRDEPTWGRVSLPEGHPYQGDTGFFPDLRRGKKDKRILGLGKKGLLDSTEAGEGKKLAKG